MDSLLELAKSTWDMNLLHQAHQRLSWETYTAQQDYRWLFDHQRFDESQLAHERYLQLGGLTLQAERYTQAVGTIRQN